MDINSKTIQASRAVNALLGLSSGDQQALLEVIEDYFDSSASPEQEENEASFDDDGEVLMDIDDGLDGNDDDCDDSVLIPKSDNAQIQDVVEQAHNSAEHDDDDGVDFVNTEERVQGALVGLDNVADVVTITSLQTDINKKEKVSIFMSVGCGCRKNNGEPCSRQFSLEQVTSFRESCVELSHNELDMALMGFLVGGMNTSPTVSVESRHKVNKRERAHIVFIHQGKHVCLKMYLFLHGIGKKRLRHLIQHVKTEGLTPRVHGNFRRRLKHALTHLSIQYVVHFLYNYAEQHALVLPGLVPGYSRTDIQLLPFSVTKRKVWNVPRAAAADLSEIHTVSYSHFNYLWRTLVPYIIVMKPRSDLCWQCQQNSHAIMRAANSSKAEKLSSISEALEHLRIVKLERTHYKSICDECKTSVRSHFEVDGKFAPPLPSSRIRCNSINIKNHLSFDFAQQVFYPSDPLQPGPIYFLTPRKCTIFGVCCESVSRQINFLTDEAGDCGKGANTVVSRIHFYFDEHGFGETDLYLHADNCTGQNKANCMIQYLLWRTMTDRHTNITLSFLPVGHTKFSPDWCFGLLKRQYRRTMVGSLTTLTEVVNTSAECNVAQLVSTEDGSTVVTTYNWTDLFATKFKKVSGIKKIHHFHFRSRYPGCVFVRDRIDSPVEYKINLFKDKKNPWCPAPNELPNIVPPKGLTAERQWYLYDNIRPFCPEYNKDSVCPLPTVLKPGGSRQATPHPPDVVDGRDDDDGSPQPKRQRVCGVCKQPGHNRRSCPDN